MIKILEYQKKFISKTTIQKHCFISCFFHIAQVTNASITNIKLKSYNDTILIYDYVGSGTQLENE